MKHLQLFALCALVSIQAARSQTVPVSKTDVLRTINVTGSAEMEVAPDEIVVVIGISEYFEEEYMPGKEYTDYKTLVPLEGIEKEFYAILQKSGIKKERLVVQNTGTNWYYNNGANKKTKDFKISFARFDELDKLVKDLQMKGLATINIVELKHKNIATYRMETKVNALKAAQEKAATLLGAVGKQLGDVVTITEIEASAVVNYMQVNKVMQQDQAGGADQAFRKIKLRYEMNVVFDIK